QKPITGGVDRNRDGASGVAARPSSFSRREHLFRTRGAEPSRLGEPAPNDRARGAPDRRASLPVAGGLASRQAQPRREANGRNLPGNPAWVVATDFRGADIIAFGYGDGGSVPYRQNAARKKDGGHLYHPSAGGVTRDRRSGHHLARWRDRPRGCAGVDYDRPHYPVHGRA